MAISTPALPSISLYGGEIIQSRIRARILEVIPEEGILLEDLFDALTAERAENSTYMVATMIENREIEYEGANDRVYVL